MADQPEFGEMRGQRRDLGGVAAVERRQRGQRESRLRHSWELRRFVGRQSSMRIARRMALRRRRARSGRTPCDAIIFVSQCESAPDFVLKLIASSTSPYVRKVRIALAEKKIDYQLVEVSPWTPGNPVHAWNPLGKVPVLVLDDGTQLFDSRVIVEYLDTVSPVSRLIPEPTPPAHRRQALGSARGRHLRRRAGDRRRGAAPRAAAEQGLDRAPATQDRRRRGGTRARARATSPGATATRIRSPTSRPAARSGTSTCATPTSTGATRTRTSRGSPKSSASARRSRTRRPRPPDGRLRPM